MASGSGTIIRLDKVETRGWTPPGAAGASKKGTLAQLPPPPQLGAKQDRLKFESSPTWTHSKKFSLVCLSLCNLLFKISVIGIIFIRDLPVNTLLLFCLSLDGFKDTLNEFKLPLKSGAQPLKLVCKYKSEKPYTKFTTLNSKKLILGVSPKKTYFDEINKGFKDGTIAQLSLQQKKELDPNSKRANAVKQTVIDDIPDHSCLNLGQLEDAADKLNDLINTNGTEGVYVHCHAGMSRSAMAVLGYLVKYENMDPMQAMAQLKAIHPQSTVGWPEGIGAGNVRGEITVSSIDACIAGINSDIENEQTSKSDKQKYKAQNKQLTRCRALFELDGKHAPRRFNNTVSSKTYLVESTKAMAANLNSAEAKPDDEFYLGKARATNPMVKLERT